MLATTMAHPESNNKKAITRIYYGTKTKNK